MTRKEQVSALACALFNKHTDIDECIAIANKYIQEAEERARAECAADTRRLEWLEKLPFEYDNDSDLLIVYHWDSKESCWLEFPKGSRKEWDKRPDLDSLKYHGPVLSPTQINEMLAAERERCAKTCEAEQIPDFSMHEQWHNNGCKCSARAIRNLGAAP